MWRPVPDGVDPALGDFRNFLHRAWMRLGLPEPTRLQYFVAELMQSSDKNLQNLCLLCFRGFGKSWITSVFGVWRLLMDPQRKFLVTSASAGKSDQAVRFMLQAIKLMPETRHLIPDPEQRSSNIMFDVRSALPAHAPSVLSLGITSNMMQGSRCDDFCGDDVETKKNSQTVTMQARIRDVCKELGGSIIRSPDEVEEPKGIYLGTPQMEDSLYFHLQAQGYTVVIIPARYPTKDENRAYGGRLASILQEDLDKDPSLVGKPTEPLRFSDTTLDDRRRVYGRRGWQLQFMLMPNLAGQDLYPLKVNDCLVMDLDPDVGPEKAIWAHSLEHRIPDLPCVGFASDYWHRPAAIVGGYRPYQRKVMAIDPSGGGGDELAYAVVFMLNAQLFVMDVGGFKIGNSDETFQALAMIAKKWGVTHIDVEKNFGDGMWTQLFRPILRQVLGDNHGCVVEEVTVHGRKELRIIDSLDAPMDSHRIIFNRSAIENDHQSVQNYDPDEILAFQLVYQMSRLTSEIHALEHDDRLDALSIAVKHFAESMSRDFHKEMATRRDEDLDDMLRKWRNDIREFGIEGHLPPIEPTWMSH